MTYEKRIVLKYGELWLKSESVKKRLIELLLKHLKETVSTYHYSVKRDRIIAIPKKPKNAANMKAFELIPGINKIEYVAMIETPTHNKETLIKQAYYIIEKEFDLKNIKTFALDVTRIGNQPYKSKDIEIELGSKIISNFKHLKVNLTKPELLLSITITPKYFYVVLNEMQGLGGLPYGSEGYAKISHPNEYLIIELVKRGLYIENIPEELRRLYPSRNISSFNQDFEVIAYTHTLEDIETLKDLKKKKDVLMLYPFILLTKQELEEKTTQAKNKIKSALNILSQINESN